MANAADGSEASASSSQESGYGTGSAESNETPDSGPRESNQYVLRLEERIQALEAEMRSQRLGSHQTTGTNDIDAPPATAPNEAAIPVLTPEDNGRPAATMSMPQAPPPPMMAPPSASPPPPPIPPPMPEQQVKVDRMTSKEFRLKKRSLGVMPSESVILVSINTSEQGLQTRSELLSTTPNEAAPEASESQTVEENSSSEHHIGKPDRIVINSYTLYDAIYEATGEVLKDNVFIRPFKILLTHEENIRKTYDEWKEKCESAKSDLEALRTQDGTEVSRTDSAHPSDTQHGLPTVLMLLEKEAAFKKAECMQAHLACLVDFLDNDMKPIFKLRREIQDASVTEIVFNDLWHLYKPGDVVIANIGHPEDQIQAFQVLNVTGGRPVLSANPTYESDFKSRCERWQMDGQTGAAMLGTSTRMTPLVIDCFFIDYNGTHFGPRSKTFVIPEFVDSQSVRDLEIVPFHFAAEKHDIRRLLIRRGKKFASLTPTRHKYYNGVTLEDLGVPLYPPFSGPLGPLRVAESTQVNSEIVLDQAAGIDHFQKKKNIAGMNFGGGVIANVTKIDKREIFEPVVCTNPGCANCTDICDDSKFDEEARAEFVKKTDLLRYATAKDLSDEHFILLPARMYGYALQERKWHAFNVDSVSELDDRLNKSTSTARGFDELVLQKGHKDLIQALVRNQTRQFHSASSDQVAGGADQEDHDFMMMDLVQGKGRGLIILLHGVPGVGKTSTAECVASQLKRPLFPITCGDLGTDPSTVEKNLEEYFKLAQRWGCVLLLDEADVFLARRSTEHLKRNGLVSVFLRVLEYYGGVLILTTNRIGEFDEAFRSRIHVSLYYPPLDEEANRGIWEMNLKRVQEADKVVVDEEEIREFYEGRWSETEERKGFRWNGRQIKNAFQTAIALANWEFHDVKGNATHHKPHLRARHFRHVANTSEHFDRYMAEVMGAEPAESWGAYKAREDRIREDAHPAMSLGGIRGRHGQNQAASSKKSAPPLNTSSAETRRLEVKIKLAKLKLAKINEAKRKGSDEEAEVERLELELELVQLEGPSGEDGNEGRGGRGSDGDEVRVFG
ncbi:hypothetical protein EJ04DRAFT_568860 [Polyplosphaeria fusca]|uniref:AAA+ ATPase domain-containing protein n=1 Tax=Polyplosphaeria fusca TaxID=682080 RepID=A0A9P4QQF3_9PLEO|nr:hypothetical protein EJ04DRAFT_568860 [Polyplosphaeria fusca]